MLTAPLIPEAEPGGVRKALARELVDAILYFLRAGMACGRGLALPREIACMNGAVRSVEPLWKMPVPTLGPV